MNVRWFLKSIKQNNKNKLQNNVENLKLDFYLSSWFDRYKLGQCLRLPVERHSEAHPSCSYEGRNRTTNRRSCPFNTLTVKENSLTIDISNYFQFFAATDSSTMFSSSTNFSPITTAFWRLPPFCPPKPSLTFRPTYARFLTIISLVLLREKGSAFAKTVAPAYFAERVCCTKSLWTYWQRNCIFCRWRNDTDDSRLVESFLLRECVVPAGGPRRSCRRPRLRAPCWWAPRACPSRRPRDSSPHSAAACPAGRRSPRSPPSVRRPLGESLAPHHAPVLRRPPWPRRSLLQITVAHDHDVACVVPQRRPQETFTHRAAAGRLEEDGNVSNAHISFRRGSLP